MKKTFGVQLSKFNPIPAKLLDSSTGGPHTSLEIDTKKLQEMFWLDSFGSFPPPAQVEYSYTHCLKNCSDFRFFGHRPSLQTAMNREISRQLGHSVFRLFMTEYCDVIFFAHMESVLDKPPHPSYPSVSLERKPEKSGDAPDYLCATSARTVLIGEAKGRFSSIAFGSAEFKNWELQFERIVVKEDDVPVRVKGVIIGTRIATDQYASVASTIYAQDPETDGIREPDRNKGELAAAVMVQHYAEILRRIGQQYIALSLSIGVSFPQNRIEFGVYTCVHPKFEKRRFVGRLFHPHKKIYERLLSDDLELKGRVLEILDGEDGWYFLGIEIGIMQVLLSTVRGDWAAIRRIPTFERDLPHEEIRFTRDGTILGEQRFFRFEANELM